MVENLDEWRLDISEWRWHRLSIRRWPRFEVRRQDRRALHLWLMRQVLTSREFGWHAEAARELQELEAELSLPVRLDLLPSLYRPALVHEALAQGEEEYRVHRVRIDGVVVRFVEETFGLLLTVEGNLPGEAVEQLRRELLEKLAALEQVPVTCHEIAPA